MNTGSIRSDQLVKGTEVRCTGLFGQGWREATVIDGKKGIIRCLSVKETNGHYPEAGDTYIDEIRFAKDASGEWVRFELTPEHAKKLQGIRAFLG